MFHYTTYLGCFLLSLIAAAGLTPWVIRLARRQGVMDQPGERKIHTRGVPLLGGVGIFIGVWLPLAFLFLWDNSVAQKVHAQGGELLLIFLGGLAMLLLGIADDKYGLNARWKFAIQIPVAMALVAVGVKFEGVRIPFFAHVSFGAAAPIVSVLWLVGVTNALNLIDGLDGLASGVTFLVAGTIAGLAIGTNQALLAVVMCSLAGACLGFLRHNFNPAKIFLGDSGSLFLGMTLAVSAVFGSVKAQLGASLLAPLVLLGYPIADTILAMARRYLSGKPIFTGDASHIHHRMLQTGLDQRKACCLIYIFCLVLCQWTIAIQLEDLRGIMLSAVLFLTVGLFGLHKLGYWRYFKLRASLAERNSIAAAQRYTQTSKERLADIKTSQEVLELLRQVSKEFGQAAVEIYLYAGPSLPGANPHWGEGSAMSPRADNKTGTIRHDKYQFDDTGLNVFAFYEEHEATEKSWMEKRTLFENVCNAADQRLLEIIQTTGILVQRQSLS